MSKKSSSPRVLLLAGIAILQQILLTACMDQEPTLQGDTAPGASIQRVAPVPEIMEVNGGKFLKDEETGQMYALNPNRTIMPQGENPEAQASGLKKTADRIRLYSATDQSGLVEIKIWRCLTEVRQEIQQGVACNVDPDYVVVGGGARTVYYGSGALLTEARPFDPGLYSYVASSKSHKSSDPHDLYVYVIGMRLVGVSRNDLWLRTEFKSATSNGPSEAPSLVVANSPGYRVIGGGARVNWTHPGNMLTASTPDASIQGWFGAGKAHKSSSPATITVYAIGLNPSIPGFGNLDVGSSNIVIYTTNGGSLTGSAAVTSGYVITCPGAESRFDDGSGRLLYGIYPNPTFHGGSYGSSKDHLTGSRGSLLVRLKQIKKAP